ncbi:putative inactive purple acid phosphatase 16 [Grifola frondosa]|uniref:Putative inactive purple acid phosphatase 16 n=1 Tax=Grifola frondosa TaxID=5627 RepID=A0A1C7MK93_GRIFR|nr:putative inactive purple acid phosphatase 16 [Grifola frondosa]
MLHCLAHNLIVGLGCAATIAAAAPVLPCGLDQLALRKDSNSDSDKLQISSRSSSPLDPYPDKPRVVFREDGTFKITVFSDLHYGENPWDAWGPQQDVNSTILMNIVLTDEKPDYVVLNGDQITGENTFRENSTTLIDEIVAPLNHFKIPFSSTQGNHDNEPNITHLEEIRREQLVAPLSYTRTVPPGIGGEDGPGTYWVPVSAILFQATRIDINSFVQTFSRNLIDQSPALVLWFFDSRGGFTTGSNSTPVPDWVDSSVAGWIQQEVAYMNAGWGPADVVGRGNLAFVHIPPHAIQALQPDLNSTQDPGLNADVLGSGSTQATTDASNDGKDQPFWDALSEYVLNLHAVISGHDHGNEWCKREPTKNVIFCFDKHSGYGGYSSAGWGHGVRNIVFSSPKVSDAPVTWIRMEDGETHARITLNAGYM